MSGGKITSDKGYTGSVVGQVYSGTTISITHCYWTSDVGCDKACGSGSPTIDNETKQVILNTTTVNSLNSYSSSWSKWLLNTNNKTVTFKVNSGNGFSLYSRLILLPSPVGSENHNFSSSLGCTSSWFEDEDCTKEFTGSSVEAETTLYGRWSYVLTFDPTGGVVTTSSKSVVYGQKYGELPSASRTGHTFNGWFTEAIDGEKITAEDTITRGFDNTLYAQWIANNYTVTLNVNGGDALPTNEFIVTYNKPYNCLPNASKTGHIFIGWSQKSQMKELRSQVKPL